MTPEMKANYQPLPNGIYKIKFQVFDDVDDVGMTFIFQTENQFHNRHFQL
jgi:hypothetical protein